MDDKFSNKDDVVLFRIAKQIRKQNQDIVGVNCVKDDDNNMIQQRKMHGKKHYFGMRLRCLRLNTQ